MTGNTKHANAVPMTKNTTEDAITGSASRFLVGMSPGAAKARLP
jgi:hypothetical protein